MHQAKICRTVFAAASSTIQPFLLSGSFRYPKGGLVGQRCAGHSLAPKHIAYLLTGVLGVPFVEQILHGNKVADSLGSIDVVHNGNIANTEAVEAFLQKLPHDKAVTPQAGMILDDQGADKALFRQLPLISVNAGLCEVCARPAIINEHTGVLKAVFLSIFL